MERKTVPIPHLTGAQMMAEYRAQHPHNDNAEAVPEVIDPESTPPYPFFRLDLDEEDVDVDGLLSHLDRVGAAS